MNLEYVYRVSTGLRPVLPVQVRASGPYLLISIQFVLTLIVLWKTTAAGALRNLAANADNQLAISQAGGIAPLLALARDGTDEQKALAAGALDAYQGRLLNKDGTPAWPWEDGGASVSKDDL